MQHAESRRLAWHLPDDFDERSAEEREEILAWVRSTILSGGTAYHRYHSMVSKHRFALRFDGSGPSDLAAPGQLRAEMDALQRFKSATLTDIGYQRSGVWGAETAAQREEHLALLFGALAALPDDEVSGLGVPQEDLTFGLLVLPSVWDWYVQWRERRRGFFTGWESEMLLLGAAFSRSQTGWLRQSPWLADRLRPIPGVVAQEEIDRICGDWDGACEQVHRHALARSKEIERVARVHRDPFEPILPILEAAILGVSFLAPCVMRLRRKDGPGWRRSAAPLAPGSAYRLSGEARRDWEHSISPLMALRYSVTFRTLA